VLTVTAGNVTGKEKVPVLSIVPETFTGENKPEEIILNAQLAPSTPFTVKFVVCPLVPTASPVIKE
tara:strand:- start:114 stop:311 length:198 start_codon:yes stop_codon:yes gene_type:complete